MSDQDNRQPEVTFPLPETETVARQTSQSVLSPPLQAVLQQEGDAEQEISKLSRRSFLWAGVAVLGSYSGLRWLNSRRTEAGVPWPFRRALEWNEQVARDYFQPARLAPTFPRLLAGEPRPNGSEGLSDDFEPSEWRLTLEGVYDRSDPVMLTLADIKALPRVEMVTELKCIEGWSQVVHWAGARFADLAAKYPPATRSGNPPDIARNPDDLMEYVGMVTPDGGYYVGLDLASALHPQTLLCYEMNGEPLTLEHGAPLRLAIPVKYGIKNIKRIGTIRYVAQRPADYWAEQGYDWYAGH